MRCRLVRNTYVDRVEYEDGPGSLQNVVQDVSRKVTKEWNVPDDTSSEVLIFSIKHYIPNIYEFDDPRIEESYTLERRKDDSSEWEYVHTFHPKFVDEDYLDDERDEQEES